ncbi:hypothetical protein [Cognatishimia maritima]|uniref:Uncharacterized protein n=1 Tax=Cognatishimia maritima TaxID=870908 RepID=A0A1M5RXL7_9RHOB|nr:hypothetical protein [Cognatishimia maritima]SHH30768.1 hypothetical protein SAMN04488044_2323 [Cognatishimia maritima]
MHIVIGLILVLVIMALLSNRKTRGCRWRMDRSQNRDGRTYFKCMACGAEAFTLNGQPPKGCEKP